VAAVDGLARLPLIAAGLLWRPVLFELPGARPPPMAMVSGGQVTALLPSSTVVLMTVV
jgi:hypothetical protein